MRIQLTASHNYLCLLPVLIAGHVQSQGGVAASSMEYNSCATGVQQSVESYHA
jgi:hypothetical protein